MAKWTEDSPLVEKAGAPAFPDAESSEDAVIVAQPRKLTLPIIRRKPKTLPVTVDEVIAWGRAQVTKPSQSWYVLCQSFCRQSYRVPAWSGSAVGAWARIPAAHKTVGGHPSDAPRGALIYFAGGQHGHVAIAIGKSTSDKCLSNDYYRKGKIDVAPRTFPRWGLRYLGWSAYTPYGSLDLDS
jgi:hypothetical protein